MERASVPSITDDCEDPADTGGGLDLFKAKLHRYINFMLFPSNSVRLIKPITHCIQVNSSQCCMLEKSRPNVLNNAYIKKILVDPKTYIRAEDQANELQGQCKSAKTCNSSSGHLRLAKQVSQFTKAKITQLITNIPVETTVLL